MVSFAFGIGRGRPESAAADGRHGANRMTGRAGYDWAKYEIRVPVRGTENNVHYIYNKTTGEVAQIKLKPMGGSLVPP